jgi:hypothetical protein
VLLLWPGRHSRKKQKQKLIDELLKDYDGLEEAELADLK